MKELHSDILIIGGGLTGLMVAYALLPLKINIIIIDKFDFGITRDKNADLRTTAISEGSKIFFEKINIWPKLSKFVEPIKFIKVVDRTENRKINFYNKNNQGYLGYVIRNIDLKNVLVSLLKTKNNIQLISSINLRSLTHSNDFIHAVCNNLKIKSKLIIAADGKQSAVRSFLKTPMYKKNYNHNALVVNFHHTKNHNATAQELFFNSGPLAILPMKKLKTRLFSSSIIWSNNKAYTSQLRKIKTNFLCSILEEKVSKYVGEIKEIVDVQDFDLSAHINAKFYDERLIYLADAAHSIHPIAGQGWNLGVRDIQNCLNVIKEGIGLGLDIGDSYVCKNYHDLSFANTYILYQITDKLNSIFINDSFVLNRLRQLGFVIIENNRKIKSRITNFAMGI